MGKWLMQYKSVRPSISYSIPGVCSLWSTPGPWFNIKMLSYQYRKSNYGDKTVVRSSYLHNDISYTGKMTSFYWISPRLSPSHKVCLSFANGLVVYLVRWLIVCLQEEGASLCERSAGQICSKPSEISQQFESLPGSFSLKLINFNPSMNK